MNAHAEQVLAGAKIEARHRDEVLAHGNTHNDSVHRHWSIVLGRLGWVALAAFTIYMFVLSVPARWDELSRPYPVVRYALTDLQMSVDFYAIFTISVEILVVLAFWTVAVVIFWHRGHDWMGLFLSSMLFTIGPASYPIVRITEALAEADPHMALPVHLLDYYSWTCVFVLFCIFPTGRFVPKASMGLAIFGAIINIFWDIFPRSPYSPWNWPALPFVALELFMWGGCIFMQVWRYRYASTPAQQQQTKWVVLGLVIAVTGCLSLYLAHVLYPPFSAPNAEGMLFIIASSTANYIFMFFFPAALLVAILRYRLWNIDVIISRTLVYIPLTGILAGLYGASITLSQKTFEAFTGADSDAAIVITTLILASLFTPIKNALQSVVDQWFKQAPDKVLHSLGDQMQEFLWLNDPEMLACRVLAEACVAFGAAGGAIYVEQFGREKLYVDYGGWHKGSSALAIPMLCKKKHVGALYLGPRHNETTYTEKDVQTLTGIVDMLTRSMDRCKRG